MKTSSRRNIPEELAELETFKRWCVSMGVAKFITEAFYDSKASICVVFLSVEPESTEGRIIRGCAYLSLRCFQIGELGCIDYGMISDERFPWCQYGV